MEQHRSMDVPSIEKGKILRRGTTQSFLPQDLVRGNCNHVLAFWQTASKDGYKGILRVFLCHLDADERQCLRVKRDVHSLPVNHMTVSFMRAIHLAYRCLGSQLFSLSFIECIAAKLAYLELSNVFTLTKENTVCIVTYNEDTMTNDNKLMVGACSTTSYNAFWSCIPTRW